MIAARPSDPDGACADAVVREQTTANSVSVRIKLFIQYLYFKGFRIVIVSFMRAALFARYMARARIYAPQLAGMVVFVFPTVNVVTVPIRLSTCPAFFAL
jgi:hypothetical protein